MLVNYLSFFLSHRLSIAEASLAQGFDVFIGYGELRGADPKALEQKGFKVSLIPMQPGGINLFKDLKTLYYIWAYFKSVKPDIVHLVTIKPYLYGGIISRLIGVKGLVSAVSGLGTLFVNKDFKARFLRLLLYPIYKFAFNHFNQKIIVQNEEDLRELLDWGVLKLSKVKLLKGSGVKLGNFKYFNEAIGITTVCFAARLLRDKGVYEYFSAARILKERGVKAHFLLAGDFDINNPSGLNVDDLNKLKEEGHVEVIGFQKDISELYAKSHIVCLPSYREGFPKSLIEAAAASRAIVTTNVPGCRDVIIPNKTGLLVPVKNSEKLADALQWLIENSKERIIMGKAGRKLAEKEFSIEKIVLNHINIYQKLLSIN
ncbi:glycosyltransferase family 4 protein [Candidatus Pelagibacter bacterium nBUS_28]|uniref:glycosyltransferase family 4 protein n=1 Tax=Candidatus Pelagibacter bacterium nBUS_28 TaxID=3374189 RepID=UPI003EC0A80E